MSDLKKVSLFFGILTISILTLFFFIKSQDGANESWSILNHLIHKSGIEGRLEGRFLHDYTTQPYDSASATDIRRRLIKSSKSWLEQQYVCIFYREKEKEE